MSSGDGDGFYTWVRSARYVWVPTTTSHRSRCLRLTPPEIRNEWCLFITVSPWVRGGPGPHLGSLGKADGWRKSRPLTLNHKVEDWGTTCYVTLINFFRLVGPPLQPVEVRLFPGIWCMVPQPYTAGGSRSYLRVLSCNQQPMVPRVNYPWRSAQK
jgi:hypothetical protein